MNANMRTGLFLAIFVCAAILIWKLFGGAAPETSPAANSVKPTSSPKTTAANGSASTPDASSSSAPSGTIPELRPELSGRQGAGAKKSVANPSGAGKIKGIVRVKEGKRPISGARVTITLLTEQSVDRFQSVRSYASPDPDAPRWDTRTNGSGEYKTEHLPVGVYSLVATNEDASATSGTVITEFDPIQEVDLELQPTDSISGVVHDEEGRPVADALVVPQQSDDAQKARVASDSVRTFSRADGAFEVRYLPKAKWKLVVRAKGFAVLLSDFVPAGTKGVVLTLKKGGSASGHVIESDTRKPVSDIQVVASGALSIDRQAVSTNANGEFEFGGLAEGPCAISIEDRTRVMLGAAPRCVIEGGNSVSGLELVVAMGAVITGRTYNADNGEAIAGVTITAGSEGRAAQRAATSGADGVYRLEGLAGGQYTLQRRWKPGLLHGEQREQKSVAVKLGEELGGIDFPIKYGLYLRGRVTDSSGKPMDRVNVTSEEVSQNGEGEDTFTTEDGKFEHRGFSAHARITIQARKGSQAAEPIGPLTFGEEDMNGVEIVMEKASSISGVVTDKSGKPLESVYITAWSSDLASGRGSGSGASSDSKGNFIVEGLLAGTYSVTMQRGDSYRSSQRQADPIQVAKGQDVAGVHLVFEDETGLTISGRVTDKAGKPIKDASTSAYSGQGNSQGWTQTDADGRYTISGLKEGAHQVNVFHQDYSQANLGDVMAGTANVDFVLEGHGAIEGQVLDAATGKPLTSFQVAQAFGANVQFGPWMQGQLVTFASPDGKFRLERVQVGDNTVFAQAKGYAPASVSVPGVQAGQTVSGVTLRLGTGATVRGLVHDAAGKPVAGAQIYLGQAPQFNRGMGGSALATTNQNGEFTLDSLAPQETTIFVAHSDFSTASVTVTPAVGRDTPVDVVMNVGGTINGTVRVGGKPAANAQVNAYNPSMPGASISGQTDASGVYTLSKVPVGVVTVNANLNSGPGRLNRATAQQAEVSAGQTTVVDFDLGGGTAALEGTVSEGSQPVNNAHVSVIVTGGSTQQDVFSAQTGPDGRYRIENLPAGNATAMVVAATGQGGAGQQRTANVQLVSGQAAHRDFDLNSGGSISGAVSGGHAGEVVSVLALRGDVSIPDLSETFFRANLDKFAGQAQAQNDVYRIYGLEPGHYTIIALAVNPASANDPSKIRFVVGGVDLAGTSGTLDLAIP